MLRAGQARTARPATTIRIVIKGRRVASRVQRSAPLAGAADVAGVAAEEAAADAADVLVDAALADSRRAVREPGLGISLPPAKPRIAGSSREQNRGRRRCREGR